MGDIVGSIIGAVSGASKDLQETQAAKDRAGLEAERTALSPYTQGLSLGQIYQAPSGDNALLGAAAGAEFGSQFSGSKKDKKDPTTGQAEAAATDKSLYGSPDISAPGGNMSAPQSGKSTAY